MKDLVNIQDEKIKDAVYRILDFFDKRITFSELSEECYDATFKVLEHFQDMEEADGDTRPYLLAFNAKEMLDLLRPFAEYIGQADVNHKPTFKYDVKHSKRNAE